MSFQGSSFGYNVNFINVKTVKCLPSSCINNLRQHYRLPPPTPNQCNGGLAGTSAIRNTIGLMPNQRQVQLRTLSNNMLFRAAPFEQVFRLSSLRPCQVKQSDGTEGNLSGENIMLDEEILKRELQIAVEEEDYVQAAKLRDSLKVLDEDSKTSLLAANARFYDSFKNGDLATMQALWSKGDHVCCVHPGASGISGYDPVMESWEVVWMNYEFPLAIELKNVRDHVRGNVGYVTCIEFVRTRGSSWGGQFVTNVFEKIGGQWFICIHHASPVDL